MSVIYELFKEMNFPPGNDTDTLAMVKYIYCNFTFFGCMYVAVRICFWTQYLRHLMWILTSEFARQLPPFPNLLLNK